MHSQQEKEMVEKIDEKIKNEQPLTHEETALLYSVIAKEVVSEVRNEQPLTPGEVAQNFRKQNEGNYPNGMASGVLAWKKANGHKEPSELTKDEIKLILYKFLGPQCWGCDFTLDPDKERSIQYLELDHIRPKSEGGTDSITNRALLCSPCNKKKSDRLTLKELRRKNLTRQEDKEHPVDLKKASFFARSVEDVMQKEREKWEHLNMLAKYEEAQASRTRKIIEQYGSPCE